MNTLYHVSDVGNRKSILVGGLKTCFDATGFGALFFTSSRPVDMLNFDVWQVNVESLELEEDFTTDPCDGGDWFMVFQDVDPSLLKLQD